MLLSQQYHHHRILQLLLFNCFIGHHLAIQIGHIVNIVEQNAEMDEKKVANRQIAQNIVDIHKKTTNANGDEKDELWEVCHLLNCANKKNIAACMRSALLINGLHPDKVGVDKNAIVNEACQVVNRLRAFVLNNEQEAHEIIMKNRANAVPIKVFDHRGQKIEMNSVHSVRKMRFHLTDENIVEVFEAIENFVMRKNESLQKKFFNMRDEIFFHRQIFFNDEFQKMLNDIAGLGHDHYDERIVKIDELFAMVQRNVSKILWSEFTSLSKNQLEQILEEKKSEILRWKQNANLAKAHKVKRFKLGEELEQLRHEKKQLKQAQSFARSTTILHLVSVISSATSSLLTAASGSTTASPSSSSKFGKLTRHQLTKDQYLAQIKSRIRTLYGLTNELQAKEVDLIYGAKNYPIRVYRKWTNWDSLTYTKAFFDTIEQMVMFNLSDDVPVNITNRMFHGRMHRGGGGANQL